MNEAVHLRLTAVQVRALDRDLDAAGADSPAGWLKSGVTSPGNVAVAGADGFLFIGDGANRWESQFALQQAMPEAWLADWARVLAARQEAAASRGIDLWNLVIPEKQVIYPEKRWPKGGPAGERRPMKQLQALAAGEAGLVYPEEALQACKSGGIAYSRRNSHWTSSGCLAVLGALLDEMGAEVNLPAAEFAARRTAAPHDLTVHFFDPAPPEAAIWLVTPGELAFDNRHFELTGQHRGSIHVLRNPAAPDPRRVVVFGDSYSYDVGFTGALSALFADVTFIWSKNVVWDLVGQYRGDIVIWESAERFLLTAPTA